MTAYTHFAALLMGFAGLVGILWANPPAVAEHARPVETAAYTSALGCVLPVMALDQSSVATVAR